jgi:hypothetical protein
MQSPQQKTVWLERLEGALREGSARQLPLMADFYAPG